jgi:biopolymer transport protein ExbD
MADKRRFYDVWIVETNTVYREVPFPVVADWVQQGRLLEDDKLRPSGTADWFRLGNSPEFSPYLPRPEPFRADDQAEALEPVELDFRYRHRHLDEDDDPDMIPLIDVSLVLLIFFMMIGTGAGAVFLPTSPAEHGDVASNPEELVLGVDLKGKGEDRTPVFMLFKANTGPTAENRDLQSVDELMARLADHLQKTDDPVEVSINANPDVKAGIVRDITARLEAPPFRGRVKKKYIGVSEKAP